MTTISFESHATSVDNEQGIASGHRDVPLSERGRTEARSLGLRYRDRRVDVVFSSDLRRAQETAAIAFGEFGIPTVVDARLRELDYGEFTGRPRADVGAERARRILEPFPGGESVAQAVERVRRFLRDILHRHKGETIVVIGHSATHYGLEHWLEGTPLTEIVSAPWTFQSGRRYAVGPDALNRIAAREEGNQ